MTGDPRASFLGAHAGEVEKVPHVEKQYEDVRLDAALHRISHFPCDREPQEGLQLLSSTVFSTHEWQEHE